MNPRRAALVLTLVSALLAIAALPAAGDPDRSGSDDWRSSGHDLANSGHNPVEHEIGPETVADLEVRWRSGWVPVYGTPVVADGIVYVANASGVLHARKARDGKRIWRTVYRDVPWSLQAGTITAPVVTEDAVFLADRVGNVRRFDRRTGSVLWKTQANTHPYASVDGDLIVYDGLVLVPVCSFENGQFGVDLLFRGNIVALDATTGEIVWRTYTTSDQSLAHPKFGAGVGVWSSPAIDPETGRLYIGTGQHYEPGSEVPDWRSWNDVDYSDSLLAIQVRTGMIEKHHQFTVGDVWGHEHSEGRDWDVGVPPNLFTLPRHDGGRRAAVGVGDKEGTYYVLDRRKMTRIWQRKISTHSVIGGIQSTASYADGVIFVAGHEMHDGSSFNEIIPDGQSFVWLGTEEGYTATQRLARTNLYALDAANGDVIWQRSLIGGVSYAPVITANGLVFLGTADGRVRAFRAETGELLFETRISRRVFGTERSDIILSMSIADGMLFVSHLGFSGGMTAFALP